MLNNKSHDHWQKRCDGLRSIRALVMGGAAEYDGFMQCLQSLKLPLADAIADLRSTLVREACATAALLSQIFGKGFAQIAEVLIPPLLKQIPVTIAAISEPSNLSLRAIFRCTHHAPPAALDPVLDRQEQVCRLAHTLHRMRPSCCTNVGLAGRREAFRAAR